MRNPSKRNSGESPHPSWMKSGSTSRKCWTVVPSTRRSLPGVMLWSSSGRKMGGFWFCIDFWRLNTRAKKDSYPLPRMQETMESMVGAWFFSTMYLKSGFWQVKMAEKSRQYTAWESFNSSGCRMDCATLGTFQWLMQKLSRRVKPDICPYLSR